MRESYLPRLLHTRTGAHVYISVRIQLPNIHTTIFGGRRSWGTVPERDSRMMRVACVKEVVERPSVNVSADALVNGVTKARLSA